MISTKYYNATMGGNNEMLKIVTLTVDALWEDAQSRVAISKMHRLQDKWAVGGTATVPTNDRLRTHRHHRCTPEIESIFLSFIQEGNGNTLKVFMQRLWLNYKRTLWRVYLSQTEFHFLILFTHLFAQAIVVETLHGVAFEQHLQESYYGSLSTFWVHAFKPSLIPQEALSDDRVSIPS